MKYIGKLLIHKKLPKVILGSLVLAIAGVIIAGHTQKAIAISASSWQAGNIISDNVFQNSSAMSVSSIQSFLNAKVGTCDTNGTQTFVAPNGQTMTHAAWGTENGDPPPYTCINEYAENISTGKNNYTDVSPATVNALTPSSLPSGWESAATIIHNAAVKYDINPEVLIVTLQKEQGLVTDNWPWLSEYQYAMGYACPDDGGCNPSDAGFYNQVDGGAGDFQYYIENNSDFNYHVGNNKIQYDVSTSCGSSTVDIQNLATAALYIYTPYQPDQAALNAGYGPGDSCSAYGNRNFWLYFNDWFGSSISNPIYSWSLVTQAAYSDAAYTNQISNSISLETGQKAYLKIVVKNTGNQVWDPYFVRLATNHPNNRASPFSDSSWLSPNRPAATQESTVEPGQTATFEFSVTAPNSIGSYSEYYSLVADGLAWMNSIGLYYPITVTPSAPYSVSILDSNAYSNSAYTKQLTSGTINVYSGNKVYVKVDIKNEGQDSLPSSTTRIATDNPRNNTDNPFYNSSWLATNRPAALTQSSIATAASGSFNFSLTAPVVTTPTTYTESFGVVDDGITWLDQDLITKTIKVSPLPPTTLKAPQKLTAGQELLSANQEDYLIMQSDGNLVLYNQNNKALWNTQTFGSGDYLIMQSDGNLVLYNQNNKALWNTQTFGSGDYLIMQSDGNLVLYNQNNKALWNTQTFN